MAQRPTVTGVIVVEEPRLQLRDIDLDRAPTRAGRTRQALMQIRRQRILKAWITALVAEPRTE